MTKGKQIGLFDSVQRNQFSLISIQAHRPSITTFSSGFAPKLLFRSYACDAVKRHALADKCNPLITETVAFF